MEKNVLAEFTDEEKGLLDDNIWAIRDLKKIEDVFISICLQDLIRAYQVAYIDGLFQNECIDEDDYDFLESLIDKIDKNRIEVIKAIENDKENWQIYAKDRIRMRDYFVENPLYPKSEYEDTLQKVYKKVMALKYQILN